VRGLEALISDWSREGVVMHAETLAAQAAKRARHLAILLVPVWLVTAALVAIALALVFRR
jgi:type VI protein secretion system component VasF